MLIFSIFVYLTILFTITTVGLFYIFGIIISCIYIWVTQLIGLTDVNKLKIDLDKIEDNIYKSIIKNHEYEINFIKLLIKNFSIKVKSYIFNQKKLNNIIFLHGANSSSYVWVHIINTLLTKYSDSNIYSVCLPGFGTSQIDDIEEFLKEDKEFVARFYSDFINQYIKHYKLNNVTLVGHSFGGYFVIDYICNIKPQKRATSIESVIVLNPFGFITSMGYQGFYTGALLKTRILNTFFNAFDTYAYNLLYFFNVYMFHDDFNGSDRIFSENHYALVSSKQNYSYLILDKFISMHENNVSVNRPLLHKILTNFNVPLHIINSEKDIMTTQALNEIIKIFQINDCNLVTVLKDKKHSPFNKTDSEIIADLINKFNKSKKFNILKLKKSHSFELKKIYDKYKSNVNYKYSNESSKNLLTELSDYLVSTNYI